MMPFQSPAGALGETLTTAPLSPVNIKIIFQRIKVRKTLSVLLKL